MVRQGLRVGVCAMALLSAVSAAPAVEVSPGVTYTEYSVSGPNKVYVIAVDRLHTEYKLEVGFAQKKRNFTSKQGTSTIASLYNTAGHQVISATNGSYFGVPPDIVGSPIASAGEILQRPDGAYDTFMYGPARKAVIQEMITGSAGTLTFANGTTLPIDQYNVPVAANKVTVLTPGYDATTGSSSIGIEVILGSVTYPMRSDKEISGIVTAVRTGGFSINNAIPAGGLVINSSGLPYNTILSNTAVGDRVRLRFATSSQAMNNADFAVTGIGWLLKGGLKQDGSNGQANNWANRPAGTPYSRDPMTVLAANDNYIFQVVCDGRCNGIVGMTFDEMCNFLIGTLGATEAINLDGGGSSTLVVNGVIKNLPSDSCGVERAVANAILLVKQTVVPSFPFVDLFPSTGRATGWDDKFAYAGVAGFSPVSPGGDGFAIKVLDAGGVNTVRRGDFADTNYMVRADVYCEYRPGDAGDGSERYALFARDSGTGALGLSTYGGGNCYAIQYDAATGQLSAGKYVNGAFTNLLGSPLTGLASRWHRLRIECSGSTITYRVNGARILTVSDASHARGYFGLGHLSTYATSSNMHGTRADNLRAGTSLAVQPGDMNFDGDVDSADFGAFQICMQGDGVAQGDLACQGARLDADGDVDETDASLFIGCWSGANVPANPACAP